MINDDELIKIFIVEATESLDNINHQLEKLRENISDKDLWSVILRELHTLKGSTRMLELLDLNGYISQLEQVIQKYHHQTVLTTDNQLQELQHALDYIRHYVNELSNDNILPKNEMLILQLDNIINSQATIQPSMDERVNTEVPAKIEKEFSAKDITRVKNELFERFNTLSAQINIARSHAEQQLKKTHHLLLEMEKQIQLTQAELRQLKLKADSNLRFPHVDKEKSDFDLLEMDKYTDVQDITRSLEEKISNLEELNTITLSALRNAEETLVDQKRITRSLEDGLTHSKLISIENLIPRLQRVVRQVSNELGKKVVLECVRIEGKIDKTLIEKLVASLEHMIRNAIDHGIEMPKIRKQLGKPECGVIKLSLFRKGNEILIELSDDGQGIDIKKVEEIAIKKGFWPKKALMSDEDAVQMIMVPGFSTKDSVTPISGQGVGLDVVNAAINRLGGSLNVETAKSIGTKYTIRLPFTISMNHALIFSVSEQLYALQFSNLIGLTRITNEKLEKILKHKNRTIAYGNKEYKLVYLAKILGEEIEDNQSSTSRPIIFLSLNNASLGLIVDKLIGSSEVVIRPPGPQLRFMKHIAGLTKLSDGKVAYVLDSAALISSVLKELDPLSEDCPKNIELTTKDNAPATKTKVLVVDDSITVRNIIKRLLEKNNFKTMIAKDAKEALAIIQESLPDIILLDIEMPVMNGYQFLEVIRGSQEYKHIPVIMITSRTSQKHRQKAMMLGANAYLVKPYCDQELLSFLQKYKFNLSS